MASAARALRVPGMRVGTRLRRDAAIYFPKFTPRAVHRLTPPPDFADLDAGEVDAHPILEPRPSNRRALVGSILLHLAAFGVLTVLLGEADSPSRPPRPITGMSVTIVDEPPAAAVQSRAPRTEVGANARASAGAAAPAALANFEIPSKAVAAGVPVVSPEAALPPAVADKEARDASEEAAPSRGDKTVMPVGQPDPRSLEEERWEGEIVALLERKKHYPSAALRKGQGDTVMLRITLDRQGQLLLAEIIKSGGIPLLNQEALALARRAAPYPTPPDSVAGDAMRLVVPIEFVVVHGR